MEWARSACHEAEGCSFCKKTLLIKTESSPRKRQCVLCLCHNTIYTKLWFFNDQLYFMCKNILYCCSVGKLCLTLCDPTDCSIPGSSVLHCLPWVTSRWLRSEVEVTQLCLTFCNPMDCAVHGFLHVRILECVAFPFSAVSWSCSNSCLLSQWCYLTPLFLLP